MNTLFSTVTLSKEGIANSETIRGAFSNLATLLEDVLPGNSRELSIVRTKLEEASFYAVKALRNYEGNRA